MRVPARALLLLVFVFAFNAAANEPKADPQQLAAKNPSVPWNWWLKLRLYPVTWKWNNPNRDWAGRTALMLAVERDQYRRVRLLLAHADTDVNAPNSNNIGETALMMARSNRVRRLLLMREDLDVNAKDHLTGRTALMQYAIAGNPAAVQLLLKREDIDVNAKDDTGATALMMTFYTSYKKYGLYENPIKQRAMQLFRLEVAEALLAHEDIDVNAKDNHGETALMLAVSDNDWAAAAKALLAREDIDVNAASKNGLTALMLAARKGPRDVVQALLAREDIDVNAASENGSTALIYAAHLGKVGIVTDLLAHADIDVNATDDLGRTALMWAAAKKQHSSVEALLKHKNIVLDARDSTGRTALELASTGTNPTQDLLLSRKTALCAKALSNAS